jgi:hypothetical protein
MKHPATAIALLALFVALGGSAFAAASAVIDGHSIKNHSIPATKLTRSAVASLRGQRGPRGFQGLQGPQGFTGATGAPGTNGAPGANGGFDPAKLSYVEGPHVFIAPGDTQSALATCPSGTAAISGGFFSSIAHIGFSETFGTTFHGIAVSNDTSITVEVFATVVCSSK